MLKFTEDHEWLSIEGDVATVGITQHVCAMAVTPSPALGAARTALWLERR